MMEPVSAGDVFAGLYAGGKKSWNPHMDLQLKPATVATILPPQYDQQMLVIYLSFLPPNSKFLTD